MSDFSATIRASSERASTWLEVFGSASVPIVSPVPELAAAPGIEAGLFYQIDLKAITLEQRTRMVQHLARTFHIPQLEVDATLEEVGCPILADDVIVTVAHPQKWL